MILTHGHRWSMIRICKIEAVYVMIQFFAELSSYLDPKLPPLSAKPQKIEQTVWQMFKNADLPLE